MSKVWTEKLQPSQVSFMNEIIEQVPEIAGARAAFIAILQDLADTNVEGTLEQKSFQFYIVDLAMGEVRGTNDKDTADEISDSDEHFVIDTLANEWVMTDGNQEIEEIE